MSWRFLLQLTGRIQEGALSPRKTPTQPPTPAKLVPIAKDPVTKDSSDIGRHRVPSQGGRAPRED